LSTLQDWERATPFYQEALKMLARQTLNSFDGDIGFKKSSPKSQSWKDKSSMQPRGAVFTWWLKT
jgi:hypothetical protein